ncbi:MAG TPA: hypothetical protein VN805_05310 [Caulobacteraceae bacterium]|nr:hypothetical protein [Caulobacteraceae bacterium]
MAGVAAASTRFELGRVIERTFASIVRNFAVFALLALLLAGIPAALTGGLLALASTGATSTPVAAGDTGLVAIGASAFSITFFVGAIAAFVLRGAIVYGAVADLNGRRASLGECLSTGLRHVGWLFLLAIVVTVAEVCGYILLIVPGLMMLTAWIVAVPAQVVERTGVFGAMQRSADLTRGHRWPIFGLMVIFVLGSGLVQGVAAAATAPLVAASATTGQVVSQVVIQPLATTLTALVAAVGVASIYFELRSAREGIGPEALAAVFD